MLANKVKIFLLEQQDIQLASNAKIRIEKTKKERLFESFKDPESTNVQTVAVIADNPLLIQFMFLESDLSYTVGRGGISISYPLILDPTYNFKERSERTDYQEQNRKLEEKHGRSENEFYTLWQAFWKEWIELLTEEPTLSRIMNKPHRSFTQVKEEMENLFKKNPRFAKLQHDNLQSLSKFSYESQTLGKLKENIKVINKAEKNSRSINNEHLRLPHDRQVISTALSKLSNFVDFSINSICLDCWYEKDQLPFIANLINTGSIIIYDRCLKCNGSGIAHKINLSFPRAFNTLMLLDSSWLYEVIIGYALSNLDNIKKIYIHKKIQAYEDGNVLKGVEVDVTVITNDDKLYLVEVTKQGDTSNIVGNITKKIKIFEDAKIPFEKVLYFTSDDQEIYLDIPKKARIFQIRHLPALLKFVSEFINDENSTDKTK